MKYFLSQKIPRAADILLMESGSPEVAQKALKGIRVIFPDARFHLCTCQPDTPPGAFASVFRVTDYEAAHQKLGLLLSFRRKAWEVLVVLCTGEPILWRWKILAIALIPAKVLIVNENADFFWLDWGNRGTLRRLLGIRWGVNGDEILHTALRALFFPITLLILLSTAAFLYSRRAWRLLRWKIKGPETETRTATQRPAVPEKVEPADDPARESQDAPLPYDKMG